MELIIKKTKKCHLINYQSFISVFNMKIKLIITKYKNKQKLIAT